jgi:hypothetical protein
MAIGGAWSPSLDGLYIITLMLAIFILFMFTGPNPTDPQTMIKTAIRTTKALTGIDLSNCPRWYVFDLLF